MAGLGAEESEVGRSADFISNDLSGEALAEWRSSEQVESGTPSTSPPYWDCDDEEDGPKPSELYGKYTWKIDKFSQIKRELRSNAFEIGGYKWYILIYPQGCDVCNHLSLFLCVANHDKLLPGWSHFAQFTIAVVNKDPKKSKYSDTLHRFWKKEHDWGWKKFMELSKVFDGFIESDTLIIKAQVQVIREKADRPFHCLDRQYRRELVRVYLSNVEQICRRFVEERRGKLRKLIEDRVRWSSFSTFWLGIDQNSRHSMSKEKTNVILKVMVKHFFIEKEVTSTLVMDSLYSGLKALEAQNKNKNERVTGTDLEETTAPIVRFEKDTFVLVDDIVVLLGRAAVEPLPPKDEKGPQNRKDENTGEDFNKDSIERDERRLTELGRRTLEMFVLTHIFSNKIEVAYQEAVALRRQEELIREEEAAWLAESEQKAKRGGKDKKSKKKQAKQKRNNRKGKDKGKEDKPSAVQQNKHQENGSPEQNNFAIEQEHSVSEKRGLPDEVSEASDLVAANEVLHPETDRDAGPVNWDTDTSEVHPPTESRSRASSLSSVQSGIAEKKNPLAMDDSSSTCSTDSIPSVVTNGPTKGNFLSNCIDSKSNSRGKNHRGKMTYGGRSATNGTNSKPSGPNTYSADLNDVPGSNKAAESEFKCLASHSDGEKCLESKMIKKEIVSQQRTPMAKDQVDAGRYYDASTAAPPSQPRGYFKVLASVAQPKIESTNTAVLDPVSIRNASLGSLCQADKSASPAMSSHVRGLSKSDTQKFATPKSVERAMAEAAPVISRPSSAPLVPAPRPVPATTVVSMVQTAPSLARSVSAAGRLGPEQATHSYFPQSYRNAIMGNTVASSSASHPNSPTSAMILAPMYTSTCSVSASSSVNHSSEKIDPNSIKSGSSFSMGSRITDPSSVNPGFPINMLNHENLQNGHSLFEISQRNLRSVHSGQSFCSDVQDFYIHSTLNNGPRENVTEILAGTSGHQTQGALVDDFPHLDIINDLLDDEHAVGSTTWKDSVFQSPDSLTHLLNGQYSLPGDTGALGDVGSSNSCRVELETQNYRDDGFLSRYPSFGAGLLDMQDYGPQVSPAPYPNGQIDGMLQNQWHMAGSDVSLYGMRNMEPDIYLPYSPDYTTLACGVNGYPVFPPSSGR